MVARLNHAGGAVITTITANINATDLSISIASATGWPTGGVNGEFYVTIDPDLPGEERVLVASRSGTTLTVASTPKRGVDGTTAATHTSGAKIIHSFSGQEADDANNHQATTTLDDHTQYMKTDGTRHDLTARHSAGSVVPTAVPVATGTALAEGSGTNAARANHVHTIGVASINTANMFAAGVVDAAAIGADQVGTSEIAPVSVTSAELADDAVIAGKIADVAIDGLALFTAAVKPAFISTSAPGSPTTDQLWYDATNNALNTWDGTRWQSLASLANFIQIHGQGSASFVAEAVKEVTVTYGVTFAATPRIFAVCRGVATSGIASVAVNADTVTNFVAKVWAGSAITGTITFNWMAIGTLA